MGTIRVSDGRSYPPHEERPEPPFDCDLAMCTLVLAGGAVEYEPSCRLPRCRPVYCLMRGGACHGTAVGLPLCPPPPLSCRMSDSPGSVLKRRMLGLKDQLVTAVAPQLVIWNVPGTPWLQGSESERNVNASRLLKALRVIAASEANANAPAPAVAVVDSGFFCHESTIHIANRRDGQEGWNCIVLNAPSAEARDALLVPVMRDSVVEWAR